MKYSCFIKLLLSFLISGVSSLTMLQAQNSASETFIPIGLLVNNEYEQEAGVAAELAINSINDQGGIGGLPLKLIRRSVEGPWGAGSNEVVDLIFNENVWAILGALKGRNMHMAEQVIAKTQVVFLSVWASDPSLSKAYVPWYFSIVPTDDQQAEVLLDEIQKDKKIKKAAVLYTAGYDGTKAFESLIRTSEKMDGPALTVMEYKPNDSEISQIMEYIKDSKQNGLILLGDELPFSEITAVLAEQDISIPLWAWISCLASKDFKTLAGNHSNKVFAFLAGEGPNEETFPFQDDALQYKKKPSVIGAYAYDGIMAIAKALKMTGNDRTLLKDNLSNIHFQGLTGVIDFDAHGRLKNNGKLFLIQE